MVWFWCRTKQAQLRALSNQFKRCYFQTHGTYPVMSGTRHGVVSTPSLAVHRIGPELGNCVRFFAAPVQAKPKYEEKDKGHPRMNEEISAQYVRLVTDQGHGVVSRYEALQRARRLNVDLVEVQQDGDPPVCKLMDYKKEMYIKQAKEKEQTKKKSDLVLRKGAMKEVRITPKIDKNDLQTKADTVKRLAERGYRIKCMAVGTSDQDLGGLLSRLSSLIEEFSLVESGPIIESKQAYVVVRHVKFGPLKKGPGKKKLLQMSNGNLDSPEAMEQTFGEPGLETQDDDVDPKESFDDFDISKNKTPDFTSKFTPETSNADRTRSENRYAATRQTNASAGSSYGMFGARKPNNDPRPVEVNRYKKEPSSQPPPSDRGARGDFGRENSNINPSSIREKQGGYRG